MKTKNEIKSLRLGNINYKLHYTENLKNPEDKDASLDAYVSFHESAIYVDKKQKEQASTVALLHEIVHIWLTSVGFRDQTEQTVDALAYQVFGTIRDNPELMKQIARAK
jgi:hypothetical protein